MYKDFTLVDFLSFAQRMLVAQRLVAMGVKIDHQGTDGASALALAAFHGFTRTNMAILGED